jgi:uncharacterized protein DUF4214/parallel beta helix pectate lyase-like protein
MALLLPSLLCLAASQASAVALQPLLAAQSTVTLNSGTPYTIGDYTMFANRTLLCNGATIQSTVGPMRISGPSVTFILDNCVINGTGWGLVGAWNGAALVLRNNTRLTGNDANTAVLLDSATLDLTGGSIDHSSWGVQMTNSTAGLHGVAITNTRYAVQNVAGTLTLDGLSQLSYLNASPEGVGVSLAGSTAYPARGATAVIRNSTFTGFLNAIDIKPPAAAGLPAGTVEVTGSTFNVPFSSALSAVDASNLLFATSRVIGAKTDGIFLVNSTGVIEDSEILGSLNTGVTFMGCAQGASIRNSLVSGSAHQGVAIVADGDRISHNVQVVDNTLKNNVIANLLVDSFSDALVQGNIMTGAPDFSVRFHGSPGVSLIADLLYKSHAGIEMKDGANASSALSIVSGHDSNGALVYASSTASFTHSAFQSNGLTAAGYSVYGNTAGKVTLQRSTLEIAGQPALNNTAGNTAAVTNNYWSSAAGPRVNAGAGSGARLDWNASNGSSATYQPFLTTSPLDARISNTFNLNAGLATQWQPDSALTLSLTGAPGKAAVSGGIVAELRLKDVSTFTARIPPAGTYADGIVAVWAEYDLLSRSGSGSLRFKATGAGATAVLSRLQPDRCWLPVSTTWNGTEIVYSPADLTTINGVFAIGSEQPDRQALARQMITSYYSDILGRAPEAGAVDSWYAGYFTYAVSSAIDVRFVPREMARIFFASAEYQARARTRDQFLRDAYQALLRRAPAQWEIDTWLSATWNQPEVVSAFAESVEFDGYIQGIFPCLAGFETSNFVTVMYVGMLDRLVDSGGLAYWKSAFDSAFVAGGIEEVRNEARYFGVQLLGSTEYSSKNPTNATHVVRLYRAYLGRFPATYEIDYWRGQLDAHLITTTGMIDQFAASAEFTGRLNVFFGPG